MCEQHNRGVADTCAAFNNEQQAVFSHNGGLGKSAGIYFCHYFAPLPPRQTGGQFVARTASNDECQQRALRPASGQGFDGVCRDWKFK